MNMTMTYKILAMWNGWKEAHDDETGCLVVWHETLGVHYSGSDAWRLAYQHKHI